MRRRAGAEPDRGAGPGASRPLRGARLPRGDGRRPREELSACGTKRHRKRTEQPDLTFSITKDTDTEFHLDFKNSFSWFYVNDDDLHSVHKRIITENLAIKSNRKC